jgi:hypothetical protein
MPSRRHEPVYNARGAYMFTPNMLHSARLAHAAILLLVCLCAPVVLASNWQTPAGQLAQKIAGVTGPGAVALEVENRSSLGQTDADTIRRELMSSLAALGVHCVSAEQAAATVQVSLSENLQSYVWVAEIHQGNNEPAVVMLTWSLSAAAGAERPTAALKINKVLLWADDNRILDVALMNGNPQHMIVLEVDNILLLTIQNGHWQQDQLAPIPHSRPWPRDMRGRVVLRKDHLLDAYLPGVFCRSTGTAALALNCRDSDDPWPIGTGDSGVSGFFASSRNFFTGALSPGVGKQTAVSPFYSAAFVPRDQYILWIFAGVDGSVHLLDGVTDQIARKLDWGSDIASVRSRCGSGGQILAAGNGEGPGDGVRAFEIVDREAVAGSEPLEFNGPVTALWTESAGDSAIAVSRNSETRKYEAYRLSVTCGQ